MGVSHENCVGDFYGRVVVFGVLLTTTHNETIRIFPQITQTTLTTESFVIFIVSKKNEKKNLL